MFTFIRNSIFGRFFTSLCCLIFSAQALIYSFGKKLLWRIRIGEDPQIYVLQKELAQANSYSRWKAIARQLDVLTGASAWKETPECDLYDWRFIQDSLYRLRETAESGNPFDLSFFLRGGLRRVLGGITNPRLYEVCHLGTKHLIEEYVSEVVKQLEYLCNTHFTDLSTQQKLAFFTETRQAFGRTALCLSGGASFGLYHIGVVRALFEAKMLPSIIAGSSVGSIIASIIASRTDAELPSLFECEPGTISFEGFRSNVEGSRKRKFWRFLKTGVLMDVAKLADCVKANIGDITFEEAYRRTGRVLNISVTSTTFEVPRLLNYLTTPHVLIWSAACASCALPGLYAPVELMAKNRDGNVVPFHPYGLKWTDGSVESDLPMARLSEQFNVNHFIVSQVNPHVIPFMSTHSHPNVGVWPRIRYLIRSEFRHRFMQLTEAGLMPPVRALNAIPGIVSQKYGGDITIVPDVGLDDYLNIISNPTRERILACMEKGLRSTFPYLEAIRTQTAIEIKLNQCVKMLKSRLAVPESESFSFSSGEVSPRLPGSSPPPSMENLLMGCLDGMTAL